MGDAADDVFDSAMVIVQAEELMLAAGCRPCPWRSAHNHEECPICRDLGWIDRDGRPCEI